MSRSTSSSVAVSSDSGNAAQPRVRPTGAALPGQVSRSVPDSAENSVKTGIARWLDWQCRMISGVHQGAVFLVSSEGLVEAEPPAVWPIGEQLAGFMRQLAEKSLALGRGVVQKASDENTAHGEVCDFVVYPVANEAGPTAVIALAIEIRSEDQRQAVLQLVEWGAVWLENALEGRQKERRGGTQLLLSAVEVLSADLPLPVVTNQLCSLLADSLGCTQVSLGVLDGMQIRLAALSHQMEFDRRLNNITRIEAAMEECVDQGGIVSLPVKHGQPHGLVRAHTRLTELPACAAVCSVALTSAGDSMGALTLVWEKEGAMDESTAMLLGDLARRLGPVLALKLRENRSGWRQLAALSIKPFTVLFGAGHLRAKLLLAGLVAVLVALGVVQTDQRIAARSVLEGTIQQAVVAPVAGYITSASARAGDDVAAGQVLAVLDDRELRLEREKLASERDKHAKGYQEALGLGDRSQISIARARIAQATAQIDLIEEQITHTRMVAPFAGTLVSGDLSRSLGAPVERGQLLFEIVPNDGFRVSLEVDERDIATIAPGLGGTLRLAGLPDQTIPLTINRVVPIATADQHGNHFRVEAELGDIPPGLRPGMQGVAKVTIGQGSVLQAWTRELVSRLRFWLWSLGF